MTNEEITRGKLLYQRIRNVYRNHPEYEKLKLVPNRYDKFVTEMSEKYGTSKENIIAQIHMYEYRR